MDEKKVREAIEALKIINLKRVHPFYDWEEMREIIMMGRCKLTSICGHDYCCIECPDNDICNIQCADKDMYEYCAECPEYEEVE